MQLNSSQENSSFNRGRSQSPQSPNDHRRPEVSLHVQLNSSLENSSFKRGQSQSPDSWRNRSMSSAEDADVEQNSLFHGTTESFAPLATSSSLDERVMMKEQFCTDTIKLATPRTESSSTNDGNKKEKMTLCVCPFNCGDEPKIWALEYHIQLQHSGRSPTGEISVSDENTIKTLLCPFECGVKSFKTQNDQREHLIKEHSCTDNLKQLTPTTESSSTNDGNRKGHVTHSGKDKNDFGDERKTEENNEIRKTYLSNTQGLTVYKFRKLLRENFKLWKWILFFVWYNHYSC